MNTRNGKRTGAAMMEFALILPVLMMVFLGTFDLAMYLSGVNTATRIARDAARVGSAVIEGADPDGSQIEQAAEDHAVEMLERIDHPCATTNDCDSYLEANWVDVDGRMFVQILIDLPHDGIFMAPDTLSASFSMMTQQQPAP